MKNHYIQATLEMIQSGIETEKVFEGLKKTMQDKGHIRLYASVLRGVLRVLETKQDVAIASVTVAKDADVLKYIDVIKTTLGSLNAGENFSTKIDETIIGGVIVKNNNTIVDRSYKTALTNLYRSSTQ
jgi:F0F1-type ATP synthase delta subunit